jgi:hypothetical protein
VPRGERPLGDGDSVVAGATASSDLDAATAIAEKTIFRRDILSSSLGESDAFEVVQAAACQRPGLEVALPFV